MSITRLQLYNGALRILGETKLSSLSEARESRRVLDDVWDEGAIDACLEAGQWVFATRAVQLDYAPSIEPDFGYRRAFTRPDDFIRTIALCEDEYYNFPLLRYVDEAGHWFADQDTIYLKYVSNDEDYGNDWSLWPPSFEDYVKAYLAAEIAYVLTKSGEKEERAKKALADVLTNAASKNALSKPTAFPPQGGWVSARSGGNGWTRRERGQR